MQMMYEPIGARWSERFQSWVFPSGGSIRPGYFEQDSAIFPASGGAHSIGEKHFHGGQQRTGAHLGDMIVADWPIELIKATN